mmetsp:Transcript_62552/g.165982  ORF Transcript_62552/g.165982 Transcript_62552/m.165982 type:complete len:358 (+) Transcript_62552:1944-3017(+)
MQVSVGLLEIILACWCNRKESSVYVLPQCVPHGFVHAGVELCQRHFPDSRVSHVFDQHPLNILPQPTPRDLMVCAPVFWQPRPKRGKHAGLVLCKVDHTLRHFGNTQHEHIALLLQACRIGHVQYNVVETCENLPKPQILTETHNCSVELEHICERSRQIRLHALSLLLLDTLSARRIVVRACSVPRRRDKVTHLPVGLFTCFCLVHCSFLGATANDGFFRRTRLICNFPALQQDVDSVRIVNLDEDDGSTNVIQQPPPALVCGTLEFFTDFNHQQVKNGVSDHYDPRDRGVEVQVAETECFHKHLQFGWVVQGHGEARKAGHEPHRLHSSRRREQRLKTRGSLEQCGIDRFSCGFP